VEPRIRWAGVDLPGEVGAGNLLCVGAVGTGKTRMHRELMRSVAPNITADSDCRVVIYDVRGDLLSELHGMVPSAEVLIFNPFDKRSVAWDVAADVQTADEARAFADSLFPSDNRGTGGFFLYAARAVVSGLIDSLNRTHPGTWDLRQLILVTRAPQRLERVLAGSNLVEQYASEANTFANVRNMITCAMHGLEPIAAAWEHADQKVSLKQWAASGRSILVLGGRREMQPSVEVVNGSALRIITRALVAGPESPDRARLWFFCDDLPAAGRLEFLPAMVNARAKGVRCVLGFHDLEGLAGVYGNRETAMEIAARCATISWLKLASAETAEWASRRTGDVISPADFLNLPQDGGGAVRGVHLIKGLGGVFESTTRYEFPKTNPADDFQPRPDSRLRLRPWSADDDKWLNDGRP